MSEITTDGEEWFTERAKEMIEKQYVAKEDLRELLERWKEGAEYAKDAGNLKEYDGIMSCHDELEQVLEE